jgi:hypothetical protein
MAPIKKMDCYSDYVQLNFPLDGKMHQMLKYFVLPNTTPKHNTLPY